MLTYSRSWKINYTFAYITVGANYLRYYKFFLLNICQAINIANKTNLQGISLSVIIPLDLLLSASKSICDDGVTRNASEKINLWFSPRLDDSPRASSEFLDPQGASRRAHAPATAPALSSCRDMDFKVVINGNPLWTLSANFAINNSKCTHATAPFLAFYRAALFEKNRKIKATQ